MREEDGKLCDSVVILLDTNEKINFWISVLFVLPLLIFLNLCGSILFFGFVLILVLGRAGSQP
jgi:hypothetical protein